MYAQSYNELVEKAMDYTLKDSLIQAEELFRKALKIDPKNTRNALLFSNLGTVQKRLGKFDEAIESYTFALNIIPYSTAMLLNRATLYMEKNLYEKAYVDYCNVIDLLPDNIEARLMRAYIYMRRREYKEARIDYNVILGNDSKNKPARLGLAMLNQKEGKYVAALDEMNLLIEEYPEDVSILKMRANIYLEQDKKEVALFDLETASRLAPSDADISKDSYAKRGPERIAAAVESERYIQGCPHLEQEIVSQPDGEAGTGEYAHHSGGRGAWQCPASIESCICMEWLRC